MDSSTHARRAGHGRAPAGFTLLAILVVLAALTLVVGMALQRGEDERRSSILVRHEALALSAAEYGLDRARGYVGSILDNEADLDKALDPLLNSNCVALPQFDTDGGTEDNLPTLAGGTKVALSGADRSFMSFPYDADGDGTPDGAYLIRIDDNDDDADGPAFRGSTNNNLAGALDCREGIDMLARPARTNPLRDRDRTVVVTVVGIAPGTDVTRAQARKVLRARLGSPPAAGLITGGSIELKGASHVCGSYGSVSVSNGGFEDGCVCGKNCSKGPPDQSCGNGNACTVQTSTSTCNADFGGAGGSCVTGAPVPPPPRVEVWSKLNAPPACTTNGSCTPFYYLRSNTFVGSGKALVYMWNYSATGCSNPQAFARIYYPGELGAPTTTPISCWKLVYDGTTMCSSTGDKVRMKDESSLSDLDPTMTTACGSAPVVWKVNSTILPSNGGTCDDPSTLYPGVGDFRYWRNYRTGGSVSYKPDTSPIRAPIPHGVWLVDGSLTFEDDTPGFTAVGAQPAQPPVTILATGDVTLDNGTVLSLPPANRDVSLLAGRDMKLGNGNTKLLTCGDPSALPPTCPSAAIMVYEQFSMGSNTHLQGQLVVQNAGTCSGTVTGKAIETAGNSTISVPALPPISAVGGATVLSWSESSL